MSGIIGQSPSNVPDSDRDRDRDRVEQSSSTTGQGKAKSSTIKDYLSHGKLTQDESGPSTSDPDKVNIPEEDEPCEHGLLDEINLTQDPESAS